MCKNFIFVFRCRRCGLWDRSRSLVLPGRSFPSSPTSIYVTPASDDNLSGVDNDDNNNSSSISDGGGSSSSSSSNKTNSNSMVMTAGAEVAPTHPPAVAVVAIRVRNTAGFTCAQVEHENMARRARGRKEAACGGDSPGGPGGPRGTKRKRADDDGGDGGDPADTHEGEARGEEYKEKERSDSEDGEEGGGDDDDDDDDDDESWRARQRCPDYALKRSAVVFLDRFCSPRCKQAYQLHLPPEPSPLRNMIRVSEAETGEGAGYDAHWLCHPRQKQTRAERIKDIPTRTCGLGQGEPAPRESMLCSDLGAGSRSRYAPLDQPATLQPDHDDGVMSNEDRNHDGTAGDGGGQPPKKKINRHPLPGW